MKRLLRGGHVVDPANGRVGIFDVLIDGERIAQVGRAADVRPPRALERVIDGRGHLVLPGFIDTHVHLPSISRAV